MYDITNECSNGRVPASTLSTLSSGEAFLTRNTFLAVAACAVLFSIAASFKPVSRGLLLLTRKFFALKFLSTWLKGLAAGRIAVVCRPCLMVAFIIRSPFVIGFPVIEISATPPEETSVAFP
ncbi:MAG: hypothetical protein OEV23_00585 [Gallionella sp.]|nr:hypothetical protein [Gallionella sp.]